jgi:hypothetical protein
MDWREATGDDTLLNLVRKARDKGEWGSGSLIVKESMIVDNESACLTIDWQVEMPTLMNHSLGGCKIHDSNERRFRKLTVIRVGCRVCDVANKHAELVE